MNQISQTWRLLAVALCALLAWWAGDARAAGKVDYQQVVAQLAQRGDAALAAYQPAAHEAAGAEFSALYFDVFEASGMEFALAQQQSSLKLTIETRFALLIRQAMRAEPKAELQASWQALLPLLQQGASALGEQQHDDGFWATALQAGLILLREGAEAMLVIAALTTYLRRSGQHGHLRALWLGVGAAVLASMALAWLSATLLARSGAMREAIEGFSLLLAAGLLAWVSLWIYSRREAQQWQRYLSSQIQRAAQLDSSWALAGTAFLAVFREGAETILFLQALGGNGSPAAIGSGLAAAALLLGCVWLLLRQVSLRLPILQFFTATAILLFVLAFSFVGKGVVELQIAGLLPASHLAGAPEWPMLGMFPTTETVAAQLALLTICVLALAWHHRRLRRAALA